MDKIVTAIKRYSEGQVFTFADLQLLPFEYQAGAKAMSRLVDEGLVDRASTGKYYKPSRSPFGDLRPAEDELLKTYLFEGGKRIAYITGHALYNQLGLTTQLSRTVQVASRDKRISPKVGNLKVKPVKSYVDVTDENYWILGLLDAIKDFREIPDRNTESALIRLQDLLKQLNNLQRTELATVSLAYPPRARALAGAILEANGTTTELIGSIAKTLNPLSRYNFAIPTGLLPSADKWNID